MTEVLLVVQYFCKFFYLNMYNHRKQTHISCKGIPHIYVHRCIYLVFESFFLLPFSVHGKMSGTLPAGLSVWQFWFFNKTFRILHCTVQTKMGHKECRGSCSSALRDRRKTPKTAQRAASSLTVVSGTAFRRLSSALSSSITQLSAASSPDVFFTKANDRKRGEADSNTCVWVCQLTLDWNAASVFVLQGFCRSAASCASRRKSERPPEQQLFGFLCSVEYGSNLVTMINDNWANTERSSDWVNIVE